MWYAPGVQLSRRGGVRVVAVLLFGKSFLASKGRTPKIDQHSALCCGMTLGPVTEWGLCAVVSVVSAMQHM